ncbi:hypothetical protein [Coraliomargarita parva]|uniref:hypothetical protein n=1 Tax=Coraliomargarita parva TaxID=3014050 RepID=UPI0022B2F9BA|nr:hypothetical protein [Coraliomargarita parva]
MISFLRSARAKCFFDRRYLILTSLFSLFLLQSLVGQTEAELYRGTWQIDTPDEGSMILIVKRNQLASYFWGDNADRTVYQGSWRMEDGVAILSWPDGSSHQIQRDNLAYGISAYDANQTLRYTVPAQQVPKEVLGQWAKPPVREQEVASDLDKAKGFFGIWKIGNGTDSHYVYVEPNRSAASTWSAQENDPSGLRGAWAKQGSELHISWDSGHYSILRENQRGFSYKRIEPGEAIEEDSGEYITATRTSEPNLPASWLAKYKEEKELSSGGIAFSSRKVARSFYRGEWLIPQKGSYERITIGRFGGLSTTADRNLEGSWLLSGQDVFLRWDDGLREILSPVGWGFVLYEYQPGRPLDGVPTRIYPAVPSEPEKLQTHLQGREEVARQLVAMAEAAGIPPEEAEASGWGRTFMRWAWPFGEDGSIPPSPQELVETEFETTSNSDPWWWPFWSENRAIAEQTEAASDSASAEEAMPVVAEPAAEEGAPQPKTEATETATTPLEKKKRSKSWAWPF